MKKVLVMIIMIVAGATTYASETGNFSSNEVKMIKNHMLNPSITDNKVDSIFSKYDLTVFEPQDEEVWLWSLPLNGLNIHVKKDSHTYVINLDTSWNSFRFIEYEPHTHEDFVKTFNREIGQAFYYDENGYLYEVEDHVVSETNSYGVYIQRSRRYNPEGFLYRESIYGEDSYIRINRVYKPDGKVIETVTDFPIKTTTEYYNN